MIRIFRWVVDGVNHHQGFDLALKDIVDAVRAYPIWMSLSWFEIRQRYVRSILGPFWMTLSTGILIFAMGPLYGRLFGATLDDYFSYLATSIVTWGFVAALVNEACQSFTSAEGFIKQSKMPFSLFVFKTISRNLIIFAHNFVVIVAVFFFFPPPIGFISLGFLLGLALTSLNAFWIGMLLGTLGTRFRDIPQIINSIVGVAFFLTPIMWKSEMLGDKAWIINFNPFFHFIEVIRKPLISNELNMTSIEISLTMIVVGFTLMMFIFSRFRARLAYWL